MYFKLVNGNGNVVDLATGEYKSLIFGNSILSNEGLNFNCTYFDSIELALKHFNIRLKTDEDPIILTEKEQFEQGLITLDDVKLLHLKFIDTSFNLESNETGQLTSSLGFDFKATRISIQDVQSQVIVGNGGIIIDMASTVHQLTDAQMRTLHGELVNYGLQLYQKTMTKKYQISTTTTYQEVKNIIW